MVFYGLPAPSKGGGGGGMGRSVSVSRSISSPKPSVRPPVKMPSTTSVVATGVVAGTIIHSTPSFAKPAIKGTESVTKVLLTKGKKAPGDYGSSFIDSKYRYDKFNY